MELVSFFYGAAAFGSGFRGEGFSAQAGGGDSRVDYVDAKSGLELTPVKFIEVTKHGILKMDSGGGPLVHLILKDSSGVLYEVALVGLGINQGDEFLKAVKGSEEILLNASTQFF